MIQYCSTGLNWGKQSFQTVLGSISEKKHIVQNLSNVVQSSFVWTLGIVQAAALRAAVLGKAILTTRRGLSGTLKLEGECPRFYSTELFNHFHKEMSVLINCTLEKHPQIASRLAKQDKSRVSNLLRQFVKSVNEGCPSIERLKERKKWYTDFMDCYRSLIKLAVRGECEEEISLFLEEVTEKKFLGTNMLGQLNALIKNYCGTESKSLQEVYTEMTQDHALRNDGNSTRLFDAQYFGNVPFSLGTVMFNEGQQAVNLIRMPAVTKDTHRNWLTDRTDKVEVIEEFEYYIRNLEKAGKKHLYVNLMLRWNSSQGARTQTIEAAGKKYPGLVVMSLDKDSIFYHQRGEFNVPALDAEDFKKTFLDRMLKKSGNFLIPEKITKEDLETILQKVHVEKFGEKSSLIKNERLNMIEEVYCRIIELGAIKYEVSSLNCSCLNCIDRGISQCYNLLRYNQAKGGNALTENELETVLLSPSVMVAERPIQQKYFDRCQLYTKELY